MRALLSLPRLVHDDFHVESAEALETGIVVRMRDVRPTAAIPVRFTAVTYDKQPIFPWPNTLSRTQCCKMTFHVI
jgi:hypothetical protein